MFLRGWNTNMSVYVHYFTKTALQRLKDCLLQKRSEGIHEGNWFSELLHPEEPSEESSEEQSENDHFRVIRTKKRSFFLKSMAVVVPSFAIKKYIQKWLVEEELYMGIEVLTLDEIAREIVNYSNESLISESTLFSFFLRQVCRNFRRNGMWIDVKDDKGQYHRVHHQSVLLQHLLDENGAERYEDALQSLQESILELLEAKASILLDDQILGETYWSEFYDVLNNNTNQNSDLFETELSEKPPANDFDQTPESISGFVSGIANKTEQLSLFSLFSPQSSNTKNPYPSQSEKAVQSDNKNEDEKTLVSTISKAKRSDIVICRVLEIFAILRGILQQEYRFLDHDEQASTFPQKNKATKSAIPIREMIISQASEILANIKNQQSYTTEEIPILPYSYISVYGFTSASGLYADLLEKMIQVLDVDLVLLKTTTPFTFSSDASNQIVNRLIHQQLMLYSLPIEEPIQEKNVYSTQCHTDFEDHKELIRWHLDHNYLHPNPKTLDPWRQFLNIEGELEPFSSNNTTSLSDSFLRPKNQSNVWIQKNRYPLYMEVSKALGMQAEIRWACNRIVQLHEQGVPYEDMAIIQRSKEGLLSMLYEECQRLGIPFSFVGNVKEHTSLSRRCSLFMMILRDRQHVSLDIFLAACDSFFFSISKSELAHVIQEYGFTSLQQLSKLSHISPLNNLLRIKKDFVQFLSPTIPVDSRGSLDLPSALDAFLEPLLEEQIRQAYMSVEGGMIFFPIFHALQKFREMLIQDGKEEPVVVIPMLSHVVISKENKKVNRIKKKIPVVDLLEIEIRTSLFLMGLYKIKRKKMAMVELKTVTLLLMELLGWYLPSSAIVENERSLIQSVIEKIALESEQFIDDISKENKISDKHESSLHNLDQVSRIDSEQLEQKLYRHRIFYWRDWLHLLGEQLVKIRDKSNFASDIFSTSIATKITGKGGGVQVLDAQEAQGRFFQHAFFLQMNSRIFPQASEEDPLFPDILRKKLLTIIPDLPIRSERGLQERHLFHILCTSSRFVYLSYLAVDEDGKEQNMSPLISPFPINYLSSPSLYSSKFTNKDEISLSLLQKLPLPPDEAVIQIGLAGDLSSEGERTLFSLAYKEVLTSSPVHNPIFSRKIGTDLTDMLYGWLRQDDLHHSKPENSTNSNIEESTEQFLSQQRINHSTKALLESIAEHYPAPYAIESFEMGPFSGLIGTNVFHFTIEDLERTQSVGIDNETLRNGSESSFSYEQSIFITNIESMIRCPLKQFLEKFLYAKPSKSKREYLPKVALFSTGQIVHNTLQEFIEQQMEPLTLLSSMSRGAQDVYFPTNEALLDTIHQKTREELSLHGTILSGFHHLAATSTLDFFDIFREHLQFFYEQVEPSREQESLISENANVSSKMILSSCLGVELESGFCIQVPLHYLQSPLSLQENQLQENIDKNSPAITLTDHFDSNTLSWIDVETHPIFHVQFKADRIDYIPAERLLHRIDEMQSVYCKTKCSNKKNCWCVLSNLPSGDYIHFVDYKTGRPVSNDTQRVSRCEKFFESTASGNKLQSLAYAASGPFLRKQFQNYIQEQKLLTQGHILSNIDSEPIITQESSPIFDRLATSETLKYQSIPQDFKTSGSLHYITPEDLLQREFAATEDTLYSVRGENTQIEHLGISVASAILARSLGLFFPRLVKTKVKEPTKVQDFDQNSMCDYCDVRQACRTWDSAERKKLIMTLEDSVQKGFQQQKEQKQKEQKQTKSNQSNATIIRGVLQSLWHIGRK